VAQVLRVPTLQAQSFEIKPQYHKKINKNPTTKNAPIFFSENAKENILNTVF
jgi:hypothetical protein